MKNRTNSTPYFGGTARDLGHVSALIPRNFRELVEGNLTLATRIGITSKEFRALDKKERDRIKRTAYLIPATMEGEGKVRRLLTEAKAIRLVFLDIDEPKEARPYFESPGVLTKALHPFSFALYTTANHTPSSPRLRLVVDADLPMKDYVQAVQTVAAMIGLPSVTTESKVAVQAMYLPVLFKDQNPDFDHPLLHYRADGRPFKSKDLNPDLNDVIGIPQGRRDNDPEAEGSREYLDALEYLREPVEGIDLGIAEEILKHLDPDMPYYEWLNVCFALKHQFGHTEDAGFALDLFNDWSSKGEKYGGSKDVRSKWKSARPATEGRAPVTMRSLVKKAAQSGWNAGKLEKHGFQALKSWIEEQTDATAMLGKAVQRIANALALSSAEEETLLHVLVDRAKKLGVKIGIPFVRAQLKQAKRIVKALELSSKDDATPAWAQGFIHIGATNQFYRHTSGEMLSPDALDNQLGVHLLEKVGPEEEDATVGTKPMIRPKDYLLNVLKVPQAYDYIYDPRKTFDQIVVQDGRRLVNTYSPTYPEADHTKAREAGKLLMEHLRNLIAEEEYVQVVLDFMTFQVQYPGKKIRWAILLQGAEGCGKTFLLEALSAVLGRDNVKSIDAHVLFSSGFNDWCVGAQVVGLEEIRVVGHNRHEVMNKLKPCITNDRVSVNRKFRDVTTTDNVTNYMMFTNHHDSLALSEGARRYFVLRSRMQTKEQVKELGEGYFPKLFKMLSKNAGGLRAWFEARDLSDEFDPNGHAPVTRYLGELVEASASEDVSAVRQAIGDSSNPLVSPKIVNTHLLLSMLELEGHKELKGQRLASILREEGYENIGRRFLVDSRQTLWAKGKLARRKTEVWDFARDWLNGKVSDEERTLLGF